MNFGFVFCGVGLFFWIIGVVYKITVCAEKLGELPNRKAYREYVTDERERRNIRVMKIGASFFILFGVFGWVISAGNSKVTINAWQTVFAIARLSLPVIIYINVSMRLLMWRFSGGCADTHFLAAIMMNFKEAGLFPVGEDMPSRIVRWTNVFFVLSFGLIIFLY